MIINCTKDELLSKINIVSKAVASKTTKPILECILIEADSEGVRLTANNAELAIRTSNMSAEIIEKGSIAPEARMFIDIIKNLPEKELSIETDKKNNMTIKSGKSKFKIFSLPGEDFPEFTNVEKNFKYETKSVFLKNMIKQTIFSVALEETKPILTGELLEIKENCFNIVAIDGFRVAFRSTAMKNTGKNISVVVPSRTLNEISRILSDKEEDIVSMYFTDSNAVFETKDFTMVSRILEGEFFKYENSFINEYNTSIDVIKSELLSSIERATLIVREIKKSPVELNITPEGLIITSSTEVGNSYEEVAVDFEGDKLKIGFNPKYLIDALRAIDDEKINLQFISELSPCIIRGIDRDDYKYLILPLRLKG